MNDKNVQNSKTDSVKGGLFRTHSGEHIMNDNGNASVSSDSLDVRQHQGRPLHYSPSTTPPPGANQFAPGPQIEGSPSVNNNSPKKIWEGMQKNFLSRGKHNKSPSNSSSGGDRSPSSQSSENSRSRKSGSSKKMLSGFSILPGSKRLVTKTSTQSVPDMRLSQSSVEENGIPVAPSLKNLSKKNRAASYGTGMNENSFPVEGGRHSENAVRGGSYFKSVFGRNNESSSNGSGHRRKASVSSDDLDVPLRNGAEKASSSPEYRHAYLTQTISEAENDTEGSALNSMLASASTPTPSPIAFGKRSNSVGNVPQLPLAHPHHSLTQSQLRSASMGQIHQSEIVETAEGIRLPVLLPPALRPRQVTPLPEPRSGGGGGGSDIGSLLSQQMQQHQQQQEVQNGHNFPTEVKSSTPNTLESYLSDPSFTVDSSPSSLVFQQHQVALDRDARRAFTTFHNDSRFGRDSSEPFLGSDLSASLGNFPQMSHHLTMVRGGMGSSQSSYNYVGSSDRYLPQRADVSTSLPLEPVDEQGIVIQHGLRLLKAIQGVDSWENGRRYLIAPAAMAYCSLTVLNKLSGELVQSAVQAAVSSSPQRFGTIDLGEALITYIGEKYHLSFGRWSSCRLVLRQNYLLEYDTSTPITGLPRGFLHLGLATAYPSRDFPDSIELHFFASPCAKSDPRVLMIRVNKRQERDHWVKCLNDAAQLRLEDMWEFDSEKEFGRGRYASVVPARRKDRYYFENREQHPGPKSNCALKIVDKNEFWRRVMKGRERADTLVRELSVQSTLTAKCGRVPTFLQLRSFFETSDNVVMELELLEGMDLFDYISRKGMLQESEAAMIIEDILRSLDAMSRVGLAHRDIKPANILMCNRERDKVCVKIGDFGMSTFVGVDGLVRGRCGTPGYVAPEILTTNGGVGYGNQVDVFSAGVTLYVMLCGYEPYYGETEKALIEANRRALVEFPESDWRDVSKEARDLIRKMMAADPKVRISAREALQHPWITRLGSKQSDNSKTPLASSDAPEAGSCTIS